MSRRASIGLSEAEVADFLDAKETIIIVSNGVGGSPHPMPMWFARDEEGFIRMTTYRKSQKIRNIERDPRVSLLAESGIDYAELKGVVIYGRAELIDDEDLALDTMRRIGEKSGGPTQAGSPDEGMRRNAAKRLVIRVKPDKIVSWDHAKLGGAY
jgi:PPOX class probable F420-dependent enzyme